MANYYFGQGKVYLAQRDSNGVPLGFTLLGNCPELTLSLSRAAVRFAEGGTIAVETALVPRGDVSMVRFLIDDFTLAHFANILAGRTTSLTGASMVDEPVIARLGKTVPLAHMNITIAPVVTGAGGSPTYTYGTDYTYNLEHGTLTFPTTSTIADNAALLVDYTYGGYDRIAAFTIKPDYFWLRFEGYNIAANPITPQILDCFKVRLRPPASVPIITEDLRVLEMEASIHFDATQPDAIDNGKFFRIKRYTP